LLWLVARNVVPLTEPAAKLPEPSPQDEIRVAPGAGEAGTGGIGAEDNEPHRGDTRREHAMATYTRLIYHLVWSTKHRHPAFFGDDRRAMHAYLYGILKAKDCHVFRIGGVEDHVHILLAVHQDTRLSDLVRELKSSSSKWIRSSGKFPEFEWWQPGLGMFTVSWNDTERLIDYIKNQEEHHKKETFLDEYRRLLHEAGLEYREEFEE
jgi:putative transposase